MANPSGIPPCPYCHSTIIVRNGKRKVYCLYKCRGCGRQFRGSGAVHGHRFPPELIGDAIEMYCRGSSLGEVVAQLAGERRCPLPSRNTVSRWVQMYFAAAALQTAGRRAQTGWYWVVVTLPTRVRGDRYWAWFVLDSPSDYLMACHVSADMDVDAACEALRKAGSRAAGMILGIVADADGPCREAVERVFPGTPGTGWPKPTVNLLPDTLGDMIQRQVSRVRRTVDPAGGLRYLEGWTVFYNHLGGDVSPEERTPGQAAGVDVPFSTWADVVRLGAPARPARG